MARILFIDDANSMRELLPLHLGKLGHTIVIAQDAIEGIKAILDNAPDLIITDLHMPYLTGMELLEAIRGDNHSKDIPVIMLTSNLHDEMWMDAMKLGVTDYLLKPVDVDALAAAIDKALRRRRTP
jgi:DNA-binding response OmpR family regulator